MISGSTRDKYARVAAVEQLVLSIQHVPCHAGNYAAVIIKLGVQSGIC